MVDKKIGNHPPNDSRFFFKKGIFVMKLVYPYETEINTPEEAVSYIKHQCDNCPHYSANWSCNGYVTAKCLDISQQVAAHFKKKTTQS